MKKLIPLAVLAAMAFTACGTVVETGPAQVAIHSEDGEYTAEQIRDCYGPSSRERTGIGDKFYLYPNDQRSWDFTGGDGAEAGPVTVTDKDGVSLQVPGTLLFTLNTTCDVLMDFHTRVGIKYGAWKADGWLQAVRLLIGQPLEKAMDQAAQKYTWRQLLQDQAIRDQWETEVGQLARAFAAEQAGGDRDYFCQPDFTGEGDCGDFTLQLQKPILPENIANALAETAAELERKNQATNAAERIDIEAESLRSLVNVLGPDAAVLYQAIKDGKVTVIPVPAGGALNITPPAVQ